MPSTFSAVIPEDQVTLWYVGKEHVRGQEHCISHHDIFIADFLRLVDIGAWSEEHRY